MIFLKLFMKLFPFLVFPFFQTEITIIDFKEKLETKNWLIVNDSVMGGISSSQLIIDAQQNGVFKGEVSLENNGGFTLAKRNVEVNFSRKYTKIQLRVKGDGKRYQFRIKSNVDENHWYIQKFETNTNWQLITLNLNEFYPSLRGKRLKMVNFNKNKIESLAFLIGNKKQENFKLTIDYIKLIK